jgi:GT2 family glycosyltransferase
MASRVSIVVPTVSAEEHLPTLLDSVAALEYPRELVETIVVDNRPTDGSRRLLAEDYPWVRVLPQRENVGFAAAVNDGARAGSGELLALCNDDMRLDPGWLRELTAALDPAAGHHCVAGVILDWNGERVDFAGGFVNLHGFAGQEAFGEPVATARIDDRRELPFACGGSMLIERQLFLELGGFDPTFFALLEDVDLGWRLHLAGHGVRLAAEARSFHRHGSTTQTLLDEDERQFLFERNALLMVVKNVGDANLASFLAYALFLLTARASSEGTSSPALRAFNDVLGRFDELTRERARVQALRRRDDAEILSGFGRPFFTASGDEHTLEAAALVRRLLGLHELVGGSGNADPTAEIRQLLEQYGVGRGPWWHLRRSLRSLVRGR